MKCIIRDDDTCALTTPEELEQCYSFLPKEIPICLSVTPFRIPGKHWDIEQKKQDVPIALETNSELVSYLREQAGKGRIDFALHGYHHVCNVLDSFGSIEKFPNYDSRSKPWWREFLYGNELKKRASHGKHYLEGLLNHEISTFVPPGNAISREGLEALIDSELNLIGSPTIDLFGAEHRPFTMYNHYNAIRRTAWKAMHRTKRFPFVMNFGSHSEMEYFILYPSSDLKNLKHDIDMVHSVNGTFVLSTHYHSFPTRIRSGETISEAFYAILEYLAAKSDVEYINYQQLWHNS